MSDFKQLAIIGPTASGKTSLAIQTASAINAHILSLDSLSIYQEIDIVSAKPTAKERGNVLHFGIDSLLPHEHFDVTLFVELYKEVYRRCHSEGKNLVIVGGTSFYLKTLLEGISPRPALSKKLIEEKKMRMQSPQDTYGMLLSIDSSYMRQIKPNDTYRIEKALEIWLATGEKPSQYFRSHPPKAVITEPLPIYEIVWEREKLRQRIRERTEKMLQEGLIDEVIMLERKYTRVPHCMKAIGIKETLAYLDGEYDKTELAEKIAVNTGRLAKRQETFNRSQFEKVTRGSLEELKKLLAGS